MGIRGSGLGLLLLRLKLGHFRLKCTLLGSTDLELPLAVDKFLLERFRSSGSRLLIRLLLCGHILGLSGAAFGLVFARLLLGLQLSLDLV